MIFITVGTHTAGFERLVRAADGLAASIAEPVLIQRGSTSFVPQKAQHFEWATSQEIAAHMRAARVVVAQAGAGTVIDAMQANRPLVLVARLRRFGENANDHQVQLAQALHQQGRAVALEEITPALLAAAIEQAARLPVGTSRPAELVTALRQKLREWGA